MKALLVLSAFTLSAATLSAQIEIRGDLGTTPTSGNWTNLTAPSTSYDAIDFNSGLDTGIDVLGGGFTGAVSNTIDIDWLESTASSDLFFTTQQVANLLVFNNVPQGVDFTLEVAFFASSSLSSDQYGGTFQLNSEGNRLADRTYTGINGPIGEWNAKDDGTVPTVDWLIWDNVNANASDQIIVRADKPFPGFNSSGVNAFRLTEAIPEPKTYALMGIGVLAIACSVYRRKRA